MRLREIIPPSPVCFGSCYTPAVLSGLKSVLVYLHQPVRRTNRGLVTDTLARRELALFNWLWVRPMDFDTFRHLPTAQVAQHVRAAGTPVCVFPLNGTRRWFLLEHPAEARADFAGAYLRRTWQRYLEVFQLCFEHGLDTLLTPIFGPDLLERGEAYRQLIEPGLVWFTQDPAWLNFYRAYDIRVRVYGDTRRYLIASPFAQALPAFDAVTRLTAHHRARRLFFGVCAHDATETVAAIGATFQHTHGRLPVKREIVEAYYGEYVEPVSLFIGCAPPTVFDMPLIAAGSEDLYFTVSPSLYLNEQTLRAILYDHLYTRRIEEDYAKFTLADWQTLRELYALNPSAVLGVGRQNAGGQFWYPTPQIRLPANLAA